MLENNICTLTLIRFHSYGIVLACYRCFKVIAEKLLINPLPKYVEKEINVSHDQFDCTQ